MIRAQATEGTGSRLGKVTPEELAKISDGLAEIAGTELSGSHTRYSSTIPSSPTLVFTVVSGQVSRVERSGYIVLGTVLVYPTRPGKSRHECAAPLAYIAGSIGTLIGADLMNLGRIQGLGAPVVSIGGAGTFDGIFLTGILAVVLAGFLTGGRRTDINDSTQHFAG